MVPGVAGSNPVFHPTNLQEEVSADFFCPPLLLIHDKIIGIKMTSEINKKITHLASGTNTFKPLATILYLIFAGKKTGSPSIWAQPGPFLRIVTSVTLAEL